MVFPFGEQICVMSGTPLHDRHLAKAMEIIKKAQTENQNPKDKAPKPPRASTLSAPFPTICLVCSSLKPSNPPSVYKHRKFHIFETNPPHDRGPFT